MLEAKLSVVIPCFNELGTISQVVEAVKASPVKNIEIIIVDDCSTDGTASLLRSQLGFQVNQVIYHPQNQGKGQHSEQGLRLRQAIL